MRELVQKIVFWFQKIILYSSYYLFFPKKDDKKIVIGITETAGVMYHISSALKDVVSVNFEKVRFFDYKYNFNLSELPKILKFILSPILLAYLCKKYKTFVYLSSKGYLLHQLDGRYFEFNFLKKRGLKVVCIFAGSDIRSYKLLNDYAEKNNFRVITHFEPEVAPGIDTPRAEDIRRKLANAADRSADIVFNSSLDQMSYFEKETKPFLYFYPDANFVKDDSKFSGEKLKIVHAPSSPTIKGTPHVREAIEKLKSEGYTFEYIELIGKPNNEVLKMLRESHIVLNQFYAFMPGMFAIEALASHTALLTSADETLEKTLPNGANKAWYVTREFQVYDNLKDLLDNPEKIKKYADFGHDWAFQNYSYTHAGVNFYNTINS